MEAQHISIITDLATVSVWAGAAAIVFHILKLPLMLGYLLCGILVGPHVFSAFPIHNEQTIRELSELGVIFLMFYIGLEFDLKKVQKILPSAALAVTLQCISLIYIGILIAPLLGWGSINGLFLGGVLAISSTMITMPILTQQNGFYRNYGQIAIGILILEDIIAILMLVILSGVGITGHFAWGTVWQVSLLVGVFVVMVFFFGRTISPYLLKLVDKAGCPEVLTIVVVGLVLGVGELSEQFHFSTELGAFLAGAIVAQSRLTHAIEEAIEPLRNLFTAIFFVTVGMLLEPEMLLGYWHIILLLTALVVIVKACTCWLGLYLAGTKPDTSFRAALCKSHIGEFSFVIATLGKSLGITHPGLTAVAVGVSLGTIIVVPFLSGRADPIYGFISKKIPRPMRELGRLYQTVLRSIKEELSRSMLLTLIRRPLLQVLIYFLIFHGIVLVSSFVARNIVHQEFVKGYETYAQIGVWVISAILCIPFLFAVIRNLNAALMIVTESTLSRSENRLLMRGSIRNIFNIVILCAVFIIFSGSYLSAVAAHLPTGLAFSIFLGLIAVMGFFFWRHLIRINSRMEYLFMQSFNQQAMDKEEERRRQTKESILKKYPWPVSVREVAIVGQSAACGQRIADLDIRDRTGASVIGLSRSGYTVYDPSPMTPLFPNDKLILIGEIAQNEEASKLLGIMREEAETAPSGFQVKQILLSPNWPIVGETLVTANLRKRHGLNIIGIQRKETRITNPKADEVFQSDDILVVVSNPQAIARFEDEMQKTSES